MWARKEARGEMGARAQVEFKGVFEEKEEERREEGEDWFWQILIGRIETLPEFRYSRVIDSTSSWLPKPVMFPVWAALHVQVSEAKGK